MTPETPHTVNTQLTILLFIGCAVVGMEWARFLAWNESRNKTIEAAKRLIYDQENPYGRQLGRL